MVATGLGATDKLSIAGDTATGTIVFSGNPPIQIPAGAIAGDLLTSDGEGNVTWAPPPAAAVTAETARAEGAEAANAAAIAAETSRAEGAEALLGPKLTQTGVQTTSATASANQIVPVSTASGPVTITLPNAPPAGTIMAVKMVIQGGTNTVTVACAGSDVLNKAGGSTSGTLTLPNQGMLLQYGNGIWVNLADDLPLTQLQTVFAPLAGWVTGTPTAPTQTAGDASTKIATDAFVATAVAAGVTAAEAAAASAAAIAYAPKAGVAGAFTVGGELTLSGGTTTAGSAPVLTPAFAAGTASQLSDLTRDYNCYLQTSATGTFSLAIGPTSTPATTIFASATLASPQLVTFRCPAAWFVLWAGTATLTQQKAIGC